MHLTRKQLILLVSLSGVALLLIIGLAFVLQCGGKRDPIPAEPSLPPATAPLMSAPPETPAPTQEPTPSASPAPTQYRLPLVPEGGTDAPTPKGTPSPSPSPSPTPSGGPEAEAAKDVRDGVYNEQIKEFMAIGTRNGEAIAVLLVRVAPPDAVIVAIPCETQTTSRRSCRGCP